MYKNVFWMIGVFSFAVLAGPLAFVATQGSAADPANLYLVMGINGQDSLETFGATQVGPENGRLAKMIQAPPDVRDRLEGAGYLMLPAASVAAICGVGAAAMAVPERNI